MLIINAGSGGIEQSGNGWTNTVEGARKEAQRWLGNMKINDGIRDVEILPGEKPAYDEGRWTFTF